MSLKKRLDNMFKTRINPDAEFKRMIDHIVLHPGNDEELIRGMQWLDHQARMRGVSFYDAAAILLKSHLGTHAR